MGHGGSPFQRNNLQFVGTSNKFCTRMSVLSGLMSECKAQKKMLSLTYLFQRLVEHTVSAGGDDSLLDSPGLLTLQVYRAIEILFRFLLNKPCKISFPKSEE